MRSKFDTGASPNARYDAAPKKQAIPVSQVEVIKIFADYNKVRKITQSMLYIEPTDSWYSIWEKEWQEKLNGTHVRVRMFFEDPSFIYFFEKTTDTYLTFVERTILATGHKAGMKNGIPTEVYAYSQRIKGNRNKRQKDLEDNDKAIALAEKNTPDLPLSLQSERLIVAHNEFTPDVDPPEITQEKGSVTQDALNEAERLDQGKVADIKPVQALTTDEEIELKPVNQRG